MIDFEYKTKWDLGSEFYTDLNDPNLIADIKKITELVDQFIEKYKGKIKTFEARDFLEYFADDDRVSKIISKIALYLFYLSSLDTQNQEIIKKQGELNNLLTDESNKLLFVSQEFKDIGYEKLIELSRENSLAEYSNYFVQKADSIKYLLDEKTEFALNLKYNSGSGALNNLYEELTGSFVFKVEIDGELKEITEEEVRSMRMSPDEKVRREAYRAIREVYGTKQNQITLGNIYNALIKDWTSEVKIRGYNNAMSQRNLSEEMPDEAINLLIEEVQNAYPLFQRYLKIKAKLLGKDKLMNWDLFAPINKESHEIKFDEGLEMFLGVIKDFDSEFYNCYKEMLIHGKIDVFPNYGKRGGAFCSYEKDFKSYVLLNYTNKIRDVSTLAHELGHAIHGYFSQDQKDQVYGSPLCLAETASIFNETILNNKLIKTLKPEETIGFLENNLNDIFSTIFRQIQYVSFEKKAHETILSGKELTFEDFNIMWRDEQIKMSGQYMDFDVEANQESSWSGIPHIFGTPFYCYSYAFGNILSFALYQQYLDEGQSFIEKYKNILRSGGSKTPYNLLKENGFDITNREFYQKGLKVVEKMIDELESLV